MIDGVSMGDDDGDMHGHGDVLDVAEGLPIPTVAIEVLEDPMSGWNLRVETTDFEIVPEHVSMEHVDGEGHMHLYINDEKITRLYSSWYHLGVLEPGEHEVRVDLSSNNHASMAVSGDIIDAVATVIVPGSESDDGGSGDGTGGDGGSAGDGTGDSGSDSDGEGHHGDGTDDHGDGEGHHGDGTDDHGDGEGHHGDGTDHHGDGEGHHGDGTDGDATAEKPTNRYDADIADAAQTIALEVVGGDVVGGYQRVKVALGSVVALHVTADMSDHVHDDVHVHGYDVLHPLMHDRPAHFAFTAEIPGVFEVELEHSGLLLLMLEVS